MLWQRVPPAFLLLALSSHGMKRFAEGSHLVPSSCAKDVGALRVDPVEQQSSDWGAMALLQCSRLLVQQLDHVCKEKSFTSCSFCPDQSVVDINIGLHF